MRKRLEKFAAPIEIIKIIAKYEPSYLLYALPQLIIDAALPLLYVYFPRLIIEQLTDNRPYDEVAGVISVYIGVLLIMNVANELLKNRSGMRAEMFSSKLKGEIGKTAMRMELKDVESPKARDRIRMANKAAELTEAMGIIQNIASSVITIAGLAFVIVRLDWFFILLVAIILAVKTVFVRSQYCYGKKMWTLDAENNRLGDYLYSISFHSEGGAKEIRLNNLQNWFMKRIAIFRNTMVDLQLGSFKRSALYNSILAVLVAVQSFVILWLLSERYIHGAITIAEFTMYIAAVTALTASLTAISEQVTNYNRQILNASNYKKVMNMAEIDGNGAISKRSGFPLPEIVEFRFKDVSFSYPNTDRQVLRDINITISDGEKLVVVGMNGAGKSTFIKLLCKFYRPTSGAITLNGVDIWDISNDDYYKIISAVFQDFANLSFTLKESISMRENRDVSKIAEITDAMGLKEWIGELPHGYETYLTKNFDPDGTELSGGQSQKIAIARAMYKDAPVLILDEPTASLDPKSESEIYADFFNMAREKTTIFISHRLAASTVADNIAVFSDGGIAEYGSHDELMRQGGIYTEMYHKQSQHYTEEKVIF